MLVAVLRPLGAQIATLRAAVEHTVDVHPHDPHRQGLFRKGCSLLAACGARFVSGAHLEAACGARSASTRGVPRRQRSGWGRARDRDQDWQVVACTYPSAPAQGAGGGSAGAAPGAHPLRQAAARTACSRSPVHLRAAPVQVRAGAATDTVPRDRKTRRLLNRAARRRRPPPSTALQKTDRVDAGTGSATRGGSAWVTRSLYSEDLYLARMTTLRLTGITGGGLQAVGTGCGLRAAGCGLRAAGRRQWQ